MNLEDFKALRATRNKDAATGGFYIGLAMFTMVLVRYFLPSTEVVEGIIGVVEFGGMAWLLYFFTIRYGKKRGDFGMGYASAYGFVIFLMLFAGIIYGSLAFVQTNIIDPEHYTAIQETVIKNNTGFTEEQKELALMAISSGLMNNPIVVIISHMLSTLLYGAMLGLVIASLAKRPPKLQ